MTLLDDCARARALLEQDKNGEPVAIEDALGWLETLVIRAEELQERLEATRQRRDEGVAALLADLEEKAAKAMADYNKLLAAHARRIDELLHTNALLVQERDGLRDRERQYREQLRAAGIDPDEPLSV